MNRPLRKLRIILFRLPVQMVLALVALVIFAAAAVGLPAIYLIRQQLEQQAWSLVEQGSRTSLSSLQARQTALFNVAVLTAQRPTLDRLLQSGDQPGLQSYLEVLRSGSQVGAVLICRAPGDLLSAAGPLDAQACDRGQDRPVPVYQIKDGVAWMLYDAPLDEGEGGLFVVVGQPLDHQMMQDLHTETGLEHLLVDGDRLLAGSFTDSASAWQMVVATGRPQALLAQASAANTLAFQADGIPYYATLQALPGKPPAFWVSALPVDNIAATQRRLTLWLSSGMLLVVLVSTALAVYLARRISRPLERLKSSAKALRMGDLATPVDTLTKVREISQVAFALEDARVALQHSLEELRREKAWTDHLLEAVVEGIVTLDRFGRITFFSQGAEHITGWRQDALIGRAIDEVFRLPDGQATFSQCISAPGGKQSLVPVLVNRRQVTLAVTVARLAPPHAGRAGVALVFRDVSDEEAMHRLLGDFMANITHEFRTPLTALAASIELLLDQLPSLSQAELEELLDSLHLGILGLQTLIDNLLEGASIEAGRFRVQPHASDLGAIVSETVRTMQPLLEKYGQRLALDLPPGLPPAWVDPRRTGQVVVNLLSNAVKWSPSGSEIGLQVTNLVEAGQPGFLRVAVSDQGPGVPAEQRQDLFNRFAHLDAQERPAQVGAGIGLSVVKAIVEAQGGQVGVADRPGGGAVFWFTVHAAPVTGAPGPSAPGGAPAGEATRE